LDNDAAGREGVTSFIQNYGNDFTINDIKCPKVKFQGKLTKDFGDYWKAVGDQAFQKFFRNCNILA
jgi:hypothetical protein